MIDFETTIFQCSNFFGSPTRVTRLKVAPNMTDPTCLHSFSAVFKTIRVILSKKVNGSEIYNLIPFNFDIFRGNRVRNGLDRWPETLKFRLPNVALFDIYYGQCGTAM